MKTALKLTLGTIALGLSLTPGVAQAQSGGGPPPANVRVDEARSELIEQRREVTGALRSPRRSQLAAQQAGLVVQLDLDEGDKVVEGQVIARLDTTLAELAVTREQAIVQARRGTVAERDAQVEKARRDQGRITELVAKSSAGAMEADDAVTNVKLAEARLAQATADLASAESELARAKEQLRQMSVVAPFKGRVVKRWTQVGQWLPEGASVVEIVALDTIEARLDVPENLIPRLMAASEATAGSGAGSSAMVSVRVRAVNKNFESAAAQVVPDADPLSRLFPVRVVLPNADEALKPGMSLVATIPTGRREMVVTVHKDALLRDDAGEYLYFDLNGAAGVARVKSLFAVGDRVVLDKDTRLPPGAKVVVEGNERLFPMQPLNILGAAAEAKK